MSERFDLSEFCVEQRRLLGIGRDRFSRLVEVSTKTILRWESDVTSQPHPKQWEILSAVSRNSKLESIEIERE